MHHEIEGKEKSITNIGLLGITIWPGGAVRLLFCTLILVFAGGISGSLLGQHFATKPELHRLCEFNQPGALERRLASGWDVNTVQNFEGRPAIPVVLASIFNVKCVDRSRIDPALALAFLQNGGRLSLDDLLELHNAANEQSIDDSPAQVELTAYLNRRLEEFR